MITLKPNPLSEAISERYNNFFGNTEAKGIEDSGFMEVKISARGFGRKYALKKFKKKNKKQRRQHYATR